MAIDAGDAVGSCKAKNLTRPCNQVLYAADSLLRRPQPNNSLPRSDSFFGRQATLLDSYEYNIIE